MATYISNDMVITNWGLNEHGQYTWKATDKRNGRSAIFVAQRTEPYLGLVEKALAALGWEHE